ncbi:ABC transporter ATP-binding protein [Mucilaginibacter gotjawali]|uniref:Lipopolysaccharide transport system ATP-binding protein n=1 Tax=Mucilaginibacter gotjawali TaxID=1550579 RepID=A0A839SGX8_9SPHI|nr:polysaccharide ABC transporter ATP-binding protein [Mucilaginibacter gotjawali]MBB3057086.1 lipopolysaccharide transport system ATP-binding protein [Mucilaginibacter gotjawali]
MTKVIKVENLSKAYQLGDFGTGTISRDLERYWARIRGKEDPFLKIGELNDRTQKGTSDIVWSLRDLNFEVERGDAVGIIGRNGAGKSTLLKILSRVTSPTVGTVKIKGRVASLLEVGTGFHPELTGRENIYLNGAILGMRKAEIKRKFDEIVDFAGVDRYIDTPVKRYSSGMYVRLAFAVAANLEAEILVVDEVLAVGDAEFQKKCLGKMGDVSKGEGKTVLFVSHNMGSVRQLCDKGILLTNGQIAFTGNTEAAIRNYMNSSLDPKSGIAAIGPLADTIKIKSVTVNGSPLDVAITPKDEINVCIKYQCLKYLPGFRISLTLFKDGVRVLTVQDLEESTAIEPGYYRSDIKLQSYFLRPGTYTVAVGGHNTNHTNFSLGNVEWFFVTDISSFEVLEEWSSAYDFNNLGIINLPNTNGVRTAIGSDD